MLEGAIAASLVIADGLLAIQMASIVVGLPIAFYMLLTGYSLMRSLFASEVVIAQETPASIAIEQTRASGEMA
ncbi:BCCT family transporter [compost metagenome]